MKQRLRIFISFAVLALLQHAAANVGPKIKKMDPAKRETIRAALQTDVANGGGAWQRWFGVACICAPHLWRKVKPAVDKNGIEIIPTQFEPGSRGGATFKGAESSRRLARAIFPLVAHGKVRLATDSEIRTAIIPFNDLEEPIFVVSSAKGDILIHLMRDPESGRYFVFFVEGLRLT
jgi:hypothetical protein